MTSSKYKIGIDFHGVITASPAFFRDFTALAFMKFSSFREDLIWW